MRNVDRCRAAATATAPDGPERLFATLRVRLIETFVSVVIVTLRGRITTSVSCPQGTPLAQA
ncbi:hypothetical protein [Actinopolymorpha pittospori]|uniref:hypothetical protein n=1 Tax=Actinopolymorpha pittospori TaxID=648752 RepID=UPI001EE2498D|nr:hypothetical protein [Actinopolymorpha pittospori]